MPQPPLSAAEQALSDAALEYHCTPTRGKIAVTPTKPLSNQRDLSLAYSPGVAYACLAIQKDPTLAADYTSRANLVGEARAVIAAMKARGAEVPIPTDVVVAKTFSADAAATVKAAADVAADDLILDIGPATAARLAAILKGAGTIVWNGPVGVFEFDAFAHGTEAVARAIAASDAFSIAGGGDTLAAIAKYGIERDIGYISTGGGAFLEVLEGKTLPAFEILARRASEG